MTARAGTVKDGELWIRCPFCGDSPYHPDRAHMSINIYSGIYHCYRCKASGRLSEKEQAQLLGFRDYLEETGEEDLFDRGQLIPGPASRRKSLLPRFHTNLNGEQFDAFEMKDPRKPGEITGTHLRGTGEKKSLTFGHGIAWAGKKLISTSDSPLRLVEGPYDVLYPKDVAAFGIISAFRNLKYLRGHYIILCPDGDIWTKPELFTSFKKFIHDYMRRPRIAEIVGIEYIPDGKDPDEVPAEDRQFISVAKFIDKTSRKDHNE
jgi:hypothetical protein